ERRAAQMRIGRLQAAKRDLQRLSRQDQRQQREHVSQALARTIPDEGIEWRVAHESVQDAPALPDRSLHRDLAADDVEDPLGLYLEVRALFADRGERARGLEAHVEAL